jgi:FeS assembly SUF system protein
MKNEELKEQIVGVLKTVRDPEIPVDIHSMGLIYGIELDGGEVRIEMTLTTPNCPVAESLPNEVKEKVAALDGVDTVQVDLVWDPPWTVEKLSEAARLEMGLM